jgi:pyrimidine-nucleoside phosphorylase
MHPAQFIDAKRCGQHHSPEELAAFISGYLKGEIADYQFSAWLMAVCLNGLTLDETTCLTDLYVQSGQTLSFKGLEYVVVDKHSTGGVGDKTTLVLMPMLRAAGVAVAKLSGRGLGFTGGTADKLEAIPGFQVDLSTQQFVQQVHSIGLALGTQTQDLAPADGKIYALRDVTATVASIPLIAASVVSKKIAAGAEVITLDIKYGQGAFMNTLPEAQELATVCREVGARLGKKISTVISAMNQPLGQSIGHTLEVIESIETLKNKGPKDLTDLCCTLGAVTLVDAGITSRLDEGITLMRKTLSEGSALAWFEKLILAQHGNIEVLQEYPLMPTAQRVVPVLAWQHGRVTQCDALLLAQAAKVLGAGRSQKGDALDLAVGLKVLKKIGDTVEKDEVLAEIYANTLGLAEAEALVKQAYRFEGVSSQTVLIEEIVLSH